MPQEDTCLPVASRRFPLAVAVMPPKAQPALFDEKSAVAKLPSLLREIAEATDYATAMEVARAKGGQRAFIPAHPNESGRGSWLVDVVGFNMAAKIGAAVCPAQCGMFFEVPKGVRNRDFNLSETLRMSLAGVPRMQIAGTLGIHYQTVQRYRRTLRERGLLPPAGGTSRNKGERHG